MTPITLVEEMLDTLPKEVWSNKDLKWLDPCNGVGTFPSVVVQRLMKGLEEVIPNAKKRYRHIIEEMIYVCEIQAKNMYIFHCVFDKQDIYELNTFYGSFLTKEFDEHMKNVWGVDKFDIVIGNPPYNQMIDMDFVKKSYSICDKILYVHPSTWLLDEKNKQKKFTSTKELIANDLESIVLFNGNGVFGISLHVPCVITYINKNKKNNSIKCFDRINKCKLTYDNINQINKFGDNEIYPKLKNKILEIASIKNLDDVVKEHQNNKYFINVAQIQGDTKFRDRKDIGMDVEMVSESYYTLCTKNVQISEEPKQQPFSFKTKIEANNFLNYIKTNFCRFSLSIYKTNKNLHRGELSSVPYLDFTQEWTDEKLYKEFNLTEEEINFINTHIPKYY
jgi:hypothetical protein